MKIGDKVKFLNEVGGGIIAAFQGKNIVLVEDEDGFRIPMGVNEVVVEQSNNYNTPRTTGRDSDKYGQASSNALDDAENRSVSALLQQGQDEKVDMSVPDVVDDDKEVAFRAKPQQRKGGDSLSAYLAFVPVSASGETASRYGMYFINDSNYYLHYACFRIVDNCWQVFSDGEAEPNTKLLIRELSREEAAGLEKLAVQMIAYKREEPFELKPSTDVLMRIDAPKFYKANAFKINAFFKESSILYALIENDKVYRALDIDAEALKKGMLKTAGRGNATPSAGSGIQLEQLEGRYTDRRGVNDREMPSYMRHGETDGTVVVDLHAEQILDTTSGMEAADILAYQLKVFRDSLDGLAGRKGQRVVFIHGKGEGVLRRAIIGELTYKYKAYTYQDASFREFGYGATMVTIK